MALPVVPVTSRKNRCRSLLSGELGPVGDMIISMNLKTFCNFSKTRTNIRRIFLEESPKLGMVTAQNGKSFTSKNLIFLIIVLGLKMRKFYFYNPQLFLHKIEDHLNFSECLIQFRLGWSEVWNTILTSSHMVRIFRSKIVALKLF